MIETAIGVGLATIALVILGFPFKLAVRSPEAADKIAWAYYWLGMAVTLFLFAYRAGTIDGARSERQIIVDERDDMTIGIGIETPPPVPMWLVLSIMAATLGFLIAYNIYSIVYVSEVRKDQKHKGQDRSAIDE